MPIYSYFYMICQLISIEDFFIQKMQDAPCQEATKAYIVNTFVGFKRTQSGNEFNALDLSDKSITIEYHRAQMESNFERYQQIGDWILFSSAMFPESFVVSSDYYDSIARLSYYKCYQIVNKQWKLFEELADNFPNVVKHLHAEMGASHTSNPLMKL